MLFRSWLSFARNRNLFELADHDQAVIREWHDRWHVQPSTARSRYDMLKAFFAFTVDMDWLERSPMAKLKPPR